MTAIAAAAMATSSDDLLGLLFTVGLPFSLAMGFCFALAYMSLGIALAPVEWFGGLPDAVGIGLAWILMLAFYAGTAGAQVLVAYHVVTDLRERCRRRRGADCPTPVS